MGKILNLLNDVKVLLVFFLAILSIILYKVNTQNMKKANIESLKNIEKQLDKELFFWKKKNSLLEQKIEKLKNQKNKYKTFDKILKNDYIRYPENETPKVLIFKK